MRNRWILVGYLILFFSVIAGRDQYINNTVLTALAGLFLATTGMLAWLWSLQPGKDEGD